MRVVELELFSDAPDADASAVVAALDCSMTVHPGDPAEPPDLRASTLWGGSTGIALAEDDGGPSILQIRTVSPSIASGWRPWISVSSPAALVDIFHAALAADPSVVPVLEPGEFPGVPDATVAEFVDPTGARVVLAHAEGTAPGRLARVVHTSPVPADVSEWFAHIGIESVPVRGGALIGWVPEFVVSAADFDASWAAVCQTAAVAVRGDDREFFWQSAGGASGWAVRV